MVLARLALLLALVLGGVFARRAGVLDERRTAVLTGYAFFVALPALIFVSTYDQRPAELASPALVGGVWIAIAVTLGLAWVVHRREPHSARRSVAMVQSYHSNYGYVGLPIVTASLGSAAAGRASMVLGAGALANVPLTVVLLVRMNGTDVAVTHQLRRLATNPILLALGVGLAVATLAVAPPTPIVDGLDALSMTALPAALLAVGASLQRPSQSDGLDRVWGVLGIKLLAMPVVGYLVLSALGADPIAIAAGVVMLGTPSAVSTYIYASELGGDARLASTNVLATTVVGLVTLSVLVVLFG